MVNLLEQGLAWLNEARSRHMAGEIEYLRESHVVPLTATPGQTVVEVSRDHGLFEQADRRIPALVNLPAAHRFLSIEPMLGPIDLDRMRTSGCRVNCGEGADMRNKTTCPVCGTPHISRMMRRGELCDVCHDSRREAMIAWSGAVHGVKMGHFKTLTEGLMKSIRQSRVPVIDDVFGVLEVMSQSGALDEMAEGGSKRANVHQGYATKGMHHAVQFMRSGRRRK